MMKVEVIMGHQEIYEWRAYFDNGKYLTDIDCKFVELPFYKITCVTLRPLLDDYPIIRYPTNKCHVIYFRRVICDITVGKVEKVYYVIGKEGEYYTIQYPDKKYRIIKNLGEIDELYEQDN
jgi:hypothetical protein